MRALAQPPPLKLEMRLKGVAGAVILALDIGPEPEACRRIAEISDAGGYDGQPLIPKASWVAVGGIAEEDRWKPISLRRARHTTHTVGAIGWNWSNTPGDGRGAFYVMTDDERGLDAAYGVIGHVATGIDILRALPLTPTAVRRGQVAPAPALLESVRRLPADIPAE